MARLIQARLPDDLAAAARRRAREKQKSMSAYVSELVRRDVRTARREAFWAEVERTMTTAPARADLAANTEVFDDTVADGLEP